MRDFYQLESRYDDLSFLEDAPLEDFREALEAGDLQEKLGVAFDTLNRHINNNTEHPDSPYMIAFSEAVDTLEALDKLYTGVRY